MVKCIPGAGCLSAGYIIQKFVSRMHDACFAVGCKHVWHVNVSNAWIGISMCVMCSSMVQFHGTGFKKGYTFGKMFVNASILYANQDIADV